MHSRASAKGVAVAACLCLLTNATGSLGASGVQDGHPPDSAQIAAAVAHLRADPNLATSRQGKALHWVKDPNAEPPRPTASWILWIRDLFAWLAESGRLLLWAVALLLIALLVIYVLRALAARRESRSDLHDARQPAPTHVRDLDIRPESLPDDVGAAALALWNAGEQRAALSLLYRGLLSRLANQYSLPIQRSTTEGDCMELATRLDQVKSGYVARVVKTWQRAVYGAALPPPEDIQALCREFASVLMAARPPDSTPQPA